MPKTLRIAGVTPGAGARPYLGLANSIGSPAVNEIRKTAQMAKAASQAPRAPGLAKGGIRKIRVRQQRFRYAPGPPAGGFSVGQPKY